MNLTNGGIITFHGDDVIPIVAAFLPLLSREQIWLHFSDTATDSIHTHIHIKDDLTIVLGILDALKHTNTCIIVDSLPLYKPDSDKHFIHLAKLIRTLLTYTYTYKIPIIILTRSIYYLNEYHPFGGKVLERASAYTLFIDDNQIIPQKNIQC